MTIEKFGVRVSNPDCLIEIDGRSFADLICYQHLHTENLKQVVAVLNCVNPDGSNELLSDVQTDVQALANTSTDALRDYLRLARDQGLRFEIDLGSGIGSSNLQ